VPDLPRHLGVGLVDRLRHRPDLALGELAAESADLALLRGQLDELVRRFDHLAILASTSGR
jgi:hypothetical protein